MEFKDLVKVWAAPDNTKLTPRQMSIRLPVHVAAKISAFCEMFPMRTRTEIMADLLSTALVGAEQGLSKEPYPGERKELEEAIESGLDPREAENVALGDRKRYYQLVIKYEKELWAEVSEGDQTAGTLDRSQTPAPPVQARGKRALRREGASTPAISKARPAAGPRSDPRSRKRETAAGRRSR
jgi:hypothetical protein